MGIPAFFQKLIALKQFEMKEGAIKLKGFRVVLLRTEILLKLQEYLIEKFGEEGKKIMYEIGKFQGLSAGAIYKNYKPGKGMSSAVMNPEVDLATKFGENSGWGVFEVTHINKDKTKIEVSCKNSPFAEDFLKKNSKSKKPICYFLSGIIAGIFEVLMNKKMGVKEKKCQSIGSSSCVFEASIEN